MPWYWYWTLAIRRKQADIQRITGRAKVFIQGQDMLPMVTTFWATKSSGKKKWKTPTHWKITWNKQQGEQKMDLPASTWVYLGVATKVLDLEAQVQDVQMFQKCSKVVFKNDLVFTDGFSPFKRPRCLPAEVQPICRVRFLRACEHDLLRDGKDKAWANEIQWDPMRSNEKSRASAFHQKNLHLTTNYKNKMETSYDFVWVAFCKLRNNPSLWIHPPLQHAPILYSPLLASYFLCTTYFSWNPAGNVSHQKLY